MATRCLSPNTSRHQNLHPKTPDGGGGGSSSSRKSTNSNPFKASNTSDALQRNSGSKAGAVPSSPSLRSSSEQKENERDLNCSKPARVRSPGMPCSKCVKNFMAPTISASSKAAAASPRRKILAEKNEVVRSSLTSASDPRESLAADEVVSKPRHGCGLQNAASFSSDGVCSEEIVLKSAMDVGFQEISDGSVSTEVDLELQNPQPVVVSSSPLSPAIVPPYDPRSNYLSPRPQFLRYRPNPRIEDYLNKEKGDLFDTGDGKLPEDSFSSESCEATSGQTEEVQSSDLQKEFEEVSSSNEVEAWGTTYATLVSEPELVPNSNNNKHFKSLSSIKFKFIPLLVLVTAFLHAPLSDPPIISSSSMSFRNHLASSSVNLKKLARSLGHWSINSFSYYYTTAASLPKEEEFTVLYLANLTAASVIDEGLEQNEQIIEKFEMEQDFKKNMEEESIEGLELEREFEVEDSGAVQDDDAEYETERMEMQRAEGWGEYIMEFHEGKIETELQEAEKEGNSAVEFEEENNADEDAMKDMEQGGNIQGIEDQKNIGVEVGLPHDIVAETEKVESREDGSDFDSHSQTQPAGFDSHHEVGNEYQISSSPKSKESAIYGSEHELSTPWVLGVFLAILLFASLVYLHSKQKHKHTPMVVTCEKVPPNKLVSTSISGGSESFSHARRSNHENTAVELEMVGDSGPSEMSTSLRSSSSVGRHGTKRVKEEENLSKERKPRRDSAVSSSSSISYGSFTTYEKLSAKKGSRDEEAITPVRRSSRIRNQITSP